MKISIIVPIYNAELYLQNCLESIQKQTTKDYELLLINDGSQDNSEIICTEYAQADKRVKVFAQKNSGVSAARNRGIREASGDYIAFIDADDTVASDYLEKLLSVMSPGGLVACPIKDQKEISKPVKLTRAQAQCSAFNNRGMQGFPVCKLFDRRLLQKEKIFFHEDIAICEDLLFVIQYIQKIKGLIIWCPACGYYYRQNPESALHGRFEKAYFQKKHLTEYEALCRAEDYLVENKAVRKAWALRRAKAAVTCLRTMVAVEYLDPPLYATLHAQAQKYWFPYLLSNQGALSSKLSIVLSAFSPQVEYRVWKMIESRK